VAAVCVFCSSSDRVDRSYLELAAAVGTGLGDRGHRLVSGGGSVSSMGAVARAAREAGAHTLGVIPQALVDLEVADHDADELRVVPDMRSRKAAMDEAADAFLALPGGLGTLEELLEIWVSRTLGLHAKPVVVLDPDDVYEPLRALVDGLVGRGFVRTEARDLVRWTASAQEALDAVETALAERPRARAVVPAAEDLLEAEP
jgi:uncharacterized protein (TIGR00730 family)